MDVVDRDLRPADSPVSFSTRITDQPLRIDSVEMGASPPDIELRPTKRTSQDQNTDVSLLDLDGDIYGDEQLPARIRATIAEYLGHVVDGVRRWSFTIRNIKGWRFKLI
ncbi:uncharacterized protein FIBRA_02606 [Fibroporia radiculosa]|uniref:Uncharacterized protein n=1 Tax=Fibroporia radiculosa TaxID=599839 RepID=J4HV73_9APHY|nr:uncharacterized protein FIBRA_02606 [Fibroporia radiculosa]CCM00572.1 predicted protein [Fibroporia radiculosa]